MIGLSSVVEDTRSLVRIDSQNPGPQEAECGNWVEGRLQGLGLEVERSRVVDDRDNLVCVFPGTQRQAPRLVFLAHMDTVPIGHGWTRPPLEGLIEDGRLYGRGACDMKAGLALGIGLMEALVKTEMKPRGDVVLIATVDEEAPGMLGVHQIVADGLISGDDQILAPEPTGMRLRIAQMGLRWMTVRVTGKMAHAGRAHLGINANHLLSEIIVRLNNVFEGLPFEDELLGRARFTAGTIRGGVSTNVVPAEAQAELDVRIVPPLTPEDAVAIVEKVASSVVRNAPGSSAEVMMLGARRPPVRASDDSKIVLDLSAAYRDITGEDPPRGGADGHEAYTDASMVAALTGSTSATVFGPGATDQAHTADEYVPIKDMELGCRLLTSMVRDW